MWFKRALISCSMSFDIVKTYLSKFSPHLIVFRRRMPRPSRRARQDGEAHFFVILPDAVISQFQSASPFYHNRDLLNDYRHSSLNILRHCSFVALLDAKVVAFSAHHSHNSSNVLNTGELGEPSLVVSHN